MAMRRNRPVRLLIHSFGNGSASSACSPHPGVVQVGKKVVEVLNGKLGEPRSYAAPERRATTSLASTRRRPRGTGRCPCRHAGGASAAESRPPRRRGTLARPSGRRRIRVPPERSGRDRATPRTAAPLRTSSKTTHVLVAAFAIASSSIAARTSGLRRSRHRPCRTRAPRPGWSCRPGRTPPGARCRPEQLRRFMPVRRASRGVEERDVVRVRELLRRCPGELAEPDGDHALRMACSSGCPVPRSVASDSAPTISAARIGCSIVRAASTSRSYSDR